MDIKDLNLKNLSTDKIGEVARQLTYENMLNTADDIGRSFYSGLEDFWGLIVLVGIVVGLYYLWKNWDSVGYGWTG